MAFWICSTFSSTCLWVGRSTFSSLQVLFPLLKLRHSEGLVGDKLGSEHAGTFTKLELESNVCPVLSVHHVIDLGCLAHVHYLRHTVHGGVLLRIVSDTNPDKTSNNCSLENWKMDKFVQFEPRQSNFLQIFSCLNVGCFLDNFLGAVPLCVRLSG